MYILVGLMHWTTEESSGVIYWLVLCIGPLESLLVYILVGLMHWTTEESSRIYIGWSYALDHEESSGIYIGWSYALDHWESSGIYICC